jgi:hypothetical protein
MTFLWLALAGASLVILLPNSTVASTSSASIKSLGRKVRNRCREVFAPVVGRGPRQSPQCSETTCVRGVVVATEHAAGSPVHVLAFATLPPVAVVVRWSHGV